MEIFVASSVQLPKTSVDLPPLASVITNVPSARNVISPVSDGVDSRHTPTNLLGGLLVHATSEKSRIPIATAWRCCFMQLSSAKLASPALVFSTRTPL